MAQLSIGFAVRAAVMVELDLKVSEVALVRLAHISDQRFLGFALPCELES